MSDDRFGNAEERLHSGMPWLRNMAHRSRQGYSEERRRCLAKEMRNEPRLLQARERESEWTKKDLGRRCGSPGGERVEKRSPMARPSPVLSIPIASPPQVVRSEKPRSGEATQNFNVNRDAEMEHMSSDAKQVRLQ